MKLCFCVSVLCLTNLNVHSSAEEARGMKTVEKQITKEDLTLSAALPEKCFSGESIDLVITIRNQRKDKVVYGCCTPPRDFNMVVLDRKGMSVSLTEFGKVMLPRDKKEEFKLVRIELPPGKEDRVIINIARVFDPTFRTILAVFS